MIGISEMDELNWLAKHRFQQAIRHEFSWGFEFNDRVGLTVQCLWRLIEGGRILVTSQDDGQMFGLPEAVDAEALLNQYLVDATADNIALHEGTLDLEIRFSTGHLLQILPDSAGYEAWQAWQQSRNFVAVGGGELAIFEQTDSG